MSKIGWCGADGGLGDAGPSDPPDADEYPEMQCPKCQRVSPDMDGFGLMFCVGCGYCTHASVTDGVCGFCGKLETECS